MSKLQAKTTKQKIEYLIDNQLPSFASRYFNYAKAELSESSLYGYSLDLASFFQYLQDSGIIIIDKMTLKDLNNISPYDIEQYLIDLRTYEVNGKIKERSVPVIHRKYFAIKSFFYYYYSNDLIENYPFSKVMPPRVIRKPPAIPSMSDNMSLLSFISDGDLPGDRAKFLQKRTRKRDTLLVIFMLFVGIKNSECVKLNIQDINLKELYINVKGRPYSKVKIPSSITTIIAEYLDERLMMTTEYGHEDALFLSMKKRRISVRAVQKLIQKYTTTLFGNNTNFRPKNLYFSYRDTVFNDFKSISKTSELTGWPSEKIYQVYKAELTQRLSDDANIFDYY